MNRIKLLFLTIFCCYFNAAFPQAAVFTPSEKLSSYLELIQQNKGFSGELLVAKGAQILYHEAT